MKKRATLFSTLTIVFFLLGCVFMFVAFFTSTKNIDSADAVPSPSNVTNSGNVEGNIGAVADISSADSSRTPQISVAAIPVEETPSTLASASSPVVPPTVATDFSGSSVPVGKEQSLEYLDDAVFLGDSITEGMELYNNSNAKIVAYKGLTTSKAMGESLEKYGNKTAVQAVSDVHAKKIYVMFGSNEVYDGGLDKFKVDYEKLIDTLKEKNSNATIFIQTIPPVTEKYSGEGHYLNNSLIDEANKIIADMAAEKNVYLLDVHGALTNATGALPIEASPVDGVHFGKDAFQKWINYLLTHTV